MRSIRKLRANWAEALHDSINAAGDRARHRAGEDRACASLRPSRRPASCPHPVPKAARGVPLQEVLRGFIVRNVSARRRRFGCLPRPHCPVPTVVASTSDSTTSPQSSEASADPEQDPVSFPVRRWSNRDRTNRHSAEQAAIDSRPLRTTSGRRLPELRKLPGCPAAATMPSSTCRTAPAHTACPNPFIARLARASLQRPDERPGRSGARSSPTAKRGIRARYKAHSYPTKVPHPAIMRLILHYTKPGDMVLDGFAGTGMTGVAAQACGSRRRWSCD